MRTNSFMSQAKTVNEDVSTNVRNLIAQYLGVNNKRVSDEALLRKDLGADWLDRLELMILIEDQFGIEIADGIVDRLEAVGDLIRFVEAQPRH
jgi:acyl carrier protein